MENKFHKKYNLGLFLLLTFFSLVCIGQTVPQGINYQGLARNSSGNFMISQPISLKIGIYSSSITGPLQWEEEHSISTNQLGIFYCVIGQGTSTTAGVATSFSSINWGAADHFIKIAMDESGGSSFVAIDTIQFWSVPYALHSGSSSNISQPLRLSQLSDVDTLGISNGLVLKWDGAQWKPSNDNDSDTAQFAFNSSFSNSSDTAFYALNVLSSTDTIGFSYNSDSAAYSSNSGIATNSQNSNYCDTATYALNSGSSFLYWNLTGNSGTNSLSNFIGTIDNVDFILKTNSLERMRITSGGKVGIGTANPSASLHVLGNDGLVAEGTFGSGTLAATGAGTRMLWYPKKAAFRVGGVSSTQWDDANIGNYSFASGYNNIGSGAYSTVLGSSSRASGMYSIAACENSIATGISSIAMGSGCIATGPYSVALGRGSLASDSSAIAMGYHPNASGKYSLAFGNYTDASGAYSIVFGYHADANFKKGSFVYADGSSVSPTMSTADNQFMVRASGGFVFYSNTALTAGVTLPAGGGSWSSVSDKHKKENFKKVDASDILEKINNLEISSWNYKTQAASIRHIGPMAQDFYKLFQLGENETTISTIDIDGVSLLAIQELSKKSVILKERSDELEKLKAQVLKLEGEKVALEKRLQGIENKLEKRYSSLALKND